MKTRKLERVHDFYQWDSYLKNSTFRTNYLKSSFIKLFSAPFRFYIYSNKENFLLGFPVIDCSIYETETLPFCYYQGVIFNSELLRGSNIKSNQYLVDLIFEAITKLTEIEKKFNFSLHPNFYDVRGFDWGASHGG